MAVSGKGVGFLSDAQKSCRKDPREGTARQKIRRNKWERRTGQENLQKDERLNENGQIYGKQEVLQNSGVRGKGKR